MPRNNQPIDSDPITATEPPPEPARLRKVPGVVDDVGLAIIRRAVVLLLARLGELGPDSAEQTGKALTGVCKTYLHDESERIREKGGE